MKINDIIIKPILTEKAINLAKQKIYSFSIDKKASKNDVKLIIEKLYQVKVKEINVSYQKGGRKKIGRLRKEIVLPSKKVAYVRLKEGTIDVFPVS